MKNGIFLLTLIVLLAGCSKTDKPTAYYGADHGDLVYTVTGIHDMTMEQTDSVSLTLKVNRSEGKFENVTLSVADAPKGVYVIYTPQSAQPSFNTVMTIVTTRAAAGDYTIHINAFSETTGSRTYDLSLHVKPYSNPALALEGKFLETGNCTVSNSISNTVYIDPIDGKTNEVKLTGLWVGGLTYTLNATIDPQNGTINIPAQTVNKADFSGNGSYTDSSASITYQVKTTIATDNCTAQLKRQ